MFENELLNYLFFAFFGLLLPSLIAIKFLDWLLNINQPSKTKRITMNERLNQKSNNRLNKI